MKKKALVAAVLAATTLTATSAFAAQNPFKDVPSDHWAYDAIAMLAQDGILEGYGDGTFNGTKAMNRYEMAEIVSKVVAKYDTARPADKGAIKKLEKEFAGELKDMDVRLSQVESDVASLKNGMKWFGDVRMRTFTNKSLENVKGNAANNNDKKNHLNEMRLRLGLYAEPAENLSVTGQLKWETDNIAGGNEWHTGSKQYESLGVNRLQLDWRAKNGFKLSAGRNELKLGQGLLYWENPNDGFILSKDFGGKVDVQVGVGDSNPATWWSNSAYTTFADIKAQVSPAVQLSVAYYRQNSDTTKSTKTGRRASWDNGATWFGNRDVQGNFKQIAYGFNAQLADKWQLIAEGVHNSADVDLRDLSTATNVESEDRNGYWARLVYGKQVWNQANTWNVYGEYFSFGGLALDSSGWAHRLNIAGGNGYGGAGAKGYGIGIGYMLAKNTNLELTYYKLKPYDSTSAGFEDYRDCGYAAFTYSF